MSYYEQAEKYYNAGEYLKFVENENNKPGSEETLYELIDGQIYMMSCKYRVNGKGKRGRKGKHQ